jgi:formimidoylglutamase
VGIRMNFLQKPGIQIYEVRQDPNDLKVKNIIMPDSTENLIDIGIIGVPFDRGVTSGGGRAGASLAPDEVRKALKKYGTTFDIERKIDISGLHIVDFGDVIVTDDIEETHENITLAVDSLLAAGILPIVIGGGHDISIGTVRALSQFNCRDIGVINIDAHFDVRKIKDGKVTSGTPFRKLIELELLNGKNFVEIGAHDNLNSKIYYDYLLSNNVSIFTLSDVNTKGIPTIMNEALKIADTAHRSVFVSIDIDSVAQCYAPGSSAPDARGFDPRQIRELAFLAGASNSVKLLDMVEINPEFDVDNRTSRLGASIIISFLNGFMSRSA